MARLELRDVSLSYPLLGRGMRREIDAQASTGAAGAVVVTSSDRSKGVLALSDISLELESGDRLGLIGHNGSGKSTLLRVMAGILEPQQGTVLAEGRIATLLSVGLGMQLDATGYRNIELMGLAGGLSRNEIAERAEEIAAFADLGPYMSMPVSTYSNGMKMRLRFAASTAFSPDILLMDEWLGAGDARFRKRADARMSEIVADAGILVLATHKHRVIANTCTHALWLDRGRPREYGPVEAVIKAYDAAQLAS